MKSVIKTVALFLTILLVACFSAYTVTSLNVATPQNFKVAKRTATTQKLSWEQVNRASGYKIYQKNAKSDKYTLIKTVENGNKTECEITNLDMESFYSFKISAFKSVFGYIAESELSAELKTCTLPRGETIKSIVEQTEKTFTVSWTKGINCDGYEVEYALNNDFSDRRTKDAPGIYTTKCKIDNLAQGETYYIRLRSYMIFDSEKLYSDYCEIYSATTKSTKAVTDIDPDKPMIALTFDDGPDFAGNSKKILDILEKYDVRATFFTVGENAKNNPENIKRKVKLGCEIGNHTYAHDHYGTSVTEKDITKCSNIIEEITGAKPTVFRSTGGFTTATIKNICKKQGMSLYYWSIDTEDWKTRDAKKIIKEALKAKDGDIILMHDIYSETAKAVKKIIPHFIKKGYQFVTVSELIKYKTGSAPKNGVQYLSATEIKD